MDQCCHHGVLEVQLRLTGARRNRVVGESHRDLVRGNSMCHAQPEAIVDRRLGDNPSSEGL